MGHARLVAERHDHGCEPRLPCLAHHSHRPLRSAFYSRMITSFIIHI